MDNDPLSLRNLPTRTAPEGLWAAVEQRLDAPRSSRWKSASMTAAAAALAAVALVTVVRQPPGDEPPSGLAENNRGVLLASARQASMQLERELVDSRSNVLAAGDAAELALLESELRLTDELLSERPRDVDLWLKRAEVLDQMARRYDSTDWHAQVRLASY